jgi:hypothetical protein
MYNMDEDRRFGGIGPSDLDESRPWTNPESGAFYMQKPMGMQPRPPRNYQPEGGVKLQHRSFYDGPEFASQPPMRAMIMPPDYKPDPTQGSTWLAGGPGADTMAPQSTSPSGPVNLSRFYNDPEIKNQRPMHTMDMPREGMAPQPNNTGFGRSFRQPGLSQPPMRRGGTGMGRQGMGMGRRQQRLQMGLSRPRMGREQRMGPPMATF